MIFFQVNLARNDSDGREAHAHTTLPLHLCAHHAYNLNRHGNRPTHAHNLHKHTHTPAQTPTHTNKPL